MKKILLTSLICSSFLFGATNEQIINFYDKVLPKGLNAKIIKKMDIKDIGGFEAVIVQISNDKMSQNDIIFTKGDLMTPDIVNIKTGVSYKESLSETMMLENVSKIYQKENKENIITIGKDKNKLTTVIFSDPECPFCRKELAEIEKRLTKENIKIILTPVHGKSSLEKSFLIYKDIKSAKSDSDKVKILRKYFNEKYQVMKNTVRDEEVKLMEDLRQKYLKAGLGGVPKKIQENDLLK